MKTLAFEFHIALFKIFRYSYLRGGRKLIVIKSVQRSEFTLCYFNFENEFPITKNIFIK